MSAGSASLMELVGVPVQSSLLGSACGIGRRDGALRSGSSTAYLASVVDSTRPAAEGAAEGAVRCSDRVSVARPAGPRAATVAASSPRAATSPPPAERPVTQGSFGGACALPARRIWARAVSPSYTVG